MIQWDEKNKMLVDYMGLPLSKEEVRNILEKAQVHLEHAPAAIFGTFVSIMEKQYPAQLSRGIGRSVEDFA